MSLELTAEVWTEVKRYISSVDRSDAAESMTGLLVEHGHTSDEIRTAFKSDSDVKRALQIYARDEQEDTSDDEEYEDDDEEDEDY